LSASPSPLATATPSPGVSPSPVASAARPLPPVALDPAIARWKKVGKVGPGPATGGAISGLVGFDAGYVALGRREPFLQPVAWTSTDGRSWDVTSLSKWVRNCPGNGPEGDEDVPDALTTAIATNGRQVIVVGAEHHLTAATCANVGAGTRPIAWVSDDGRTWRRSKPFYAEGANDRAEAVWAIPGGWRAVTTAPRCTLWQSADGLDWKSIGELKDGLSPDVCIATSADGTIVSSRRELGFSRLRLYRNLDGLGLTWQPIDNAGGCEKGATDILPPRSPGLDAWVVLSDLKICTSVDLKAWSTNELGMFVCCRGRIAQTRFGAIAIGDTCYGGGVVCPDLGARAYLTADGATWSRLDHPKAYDDLYVADGPAGVLLLGTGPDDLYWPAVWLLEP
jgi:hypothetical protein